MDSNKIHDRGVVAKSNRLGGIRVGLGVCGGIGSVEVVKIIREIRRHGASVDAFITRSVENFITPLSIEWASERPVVKESTARVEYLDAFDAVVVAPLTLNTLSKAAVGICDNPVTLLIAGQIGRHGPLLFVPTMNQSLFEHPSFIAHRRCLEQWGARFMDCPLEESRLKMPAPERFVTEIESIVGRG